MNHFAIAENESKARIRLNLMEKLVQPCGPPPEKKIRRLAMLLNFFQENAYFTLQFVF